MSGSVPGTPSLLRAINDRAALRLLLERGPLTRPELGALTGLSKPTASQLLLRLREAGLVVLDGVREGLPGRTAEVYRVNASAAYAAALDVTSGRIEARVADLTGAVVGEHVLEPPGGDLIGGLRAALAGARPPAPPRHLVIGVQAAVDPATGRLGYATAEDMPGWHVDDLVDRLSRGLGVPVSVENNVNLVALAERAHGAAAGTPDFVLLWADAGIGSAIVLGGRLHRGATGGAGEVGYMPAPGAPTARESGPYADHGFQALSGGAAVLRVLRRHGIPGADLRETVRNAARAAEDPSAGPPQESTAANPPDTRLADGVEAVPAGSGEAALREVAGRLAVGLAAITSVMDPALIVLTGAVPLAGGEPLRRLIEEELHALTIARPRVRLSQVAGNPVLVGALDLALATVRDEVLDSTGVTA
ncbi:ROK family transcriptional regulator [Nonomuraea ferruginea]|uniref:ROK family transcriptional regulator n=1 Tax=Nonomuraea ferruginea TaxID=46174 RepID=A0ABT4T223_9ACTN|nr:ROK family transcriptional regulator [Nonomuraea ferruginea]MDA0643435.1 ROK family transcriptional regulator [Nonomuraea ferruginea]